jgi:hypothetical protein
LGKAIDALTEPIVLDQLLPLGDQLVAFRGQAPTALIHFLRAMLELRQLKQTGLIHVDQPAPLRVSRLEPSVEPAELGDQQLVIGCWHAAGQRGFSGQQDLRSEQGVAHLRKDERVECIGTDAVLSATQVFTSGSQGITMRADVVALRAARLPRPPTDGLDAVGDHAAGPTPHQAPQQPLAGFGPTRAEPGVVVAHLLRGIEGLLAHHGWHWERNPF